MNLATLKFRMGKKHEQCKKLMKKEKHILIISKIKSKLKSTYNLDRQVMVYSGVEGNK